MFKGYEPCPDCGSRDNLAVYQDEDGKERRYCFSCQELKGKGSSKPRMSWPLPGFSYQTIPFRKILKDTCVKFQVSSRGRVVHFPSPDKRGYKLRDFNFPKELKLIHMAVEGNYSGSLFGLSSIHTKSTVAIAFGEFDAMAVTQETGIPCLSPMNGDGSLIRGIKGAWSVLSKMEKIIFLPDPHNSKAKKQCLEYVEEAAELLGVHKCFISELAYDPNDYLMRGQGELLKKAFWSAKPVSQRLFYTDLTELISDSELGVLTGIEPLDKLTLGLRSGECTYLLGRPHVGKTKLGQYMVYSLAERKVNTAVLCLEGGHKSFVTSLANVFCGGNSIGLSREDRSKVAQKMSEHVNISKLNGMSSVEEISEHVTTAAKVLDAKVILLDNLTSAGDPEKLFESSSRVVLELDRLSNELGIHIIVICHVTRQSYDAPPTMSSGTGSGFVEKFAWNLIGLHRLEDNELRIELLKSRTTGSLGCIVGKYDKATARYTSFKEVDERYGMERREVDAKNALSTRF